MASLAYSESVFVNCPFDSDYKSLLNAIIFVVHDCGYIARSALEIQDSSQNRFEKIVRIIKECKLGIHDLSRTELDSKTGLPRFNMPLELGLFLGAGRYGDSAQKAKNCLVLDKARFRYQKYMSDIAGQDIESHGNSPKRLISIVRDWLRNVSRRSTLPGGQAIWDRYQKFRNELPIMCKSIHLTENELVFNDYTNLVSEWLRKNLL